MKTSGKLIVYLILVSCLAMACGDDVDNPSIVWFPDDPAAFDQVRFSIRGNYDDVTWLFNDEKDTSCNDSNSCTRVFTEVGKHTVKVQVESETDFFVSTNTTESSDTATITIRVPELGVEANVSGIGTTYTVTVNETSGLCGVNDVVVPVVLATSSGNVDVSQNMGSLSALGTTSQSFTASEVFSSVEAGTPTWMHGCPTR